MDFFCVCVCVCCDDKPHCVVPVCHCAYKNSITCVQWTYVAHYILLFLSCTYIFIYLVKLTVLFFLYCANYTKANSSYPDSNMNMVIDGN